MHNNPILVFSFNIINNISVGFVYNGMFACFFQ